MYWNEMGDEITKEEFESPQYHEPTPEPIYDNSGYYGLAEDNEIWNREFDKRRALETTGVSKGVRSNTRASSGQSTYGEKIAPYTIGKLPTLEYDTFTAPTRDPNRISNLRARASGAGLRDLRRQTQRTIQGTSGMDATMRRMTLKDALMGYGSGVSKIMGQADRIAQNQYEQEYGDKYKEAMLNYQAGISKANAEYQARLQRLIFNAQNPQAGNRIISDRDYDYRG
ncbi:MAG: hypothetical protein ILNGONEN_01018 [Syntrophorhabdaceae bacterium]|nr:hypothetical protein [Syntrophorhabdaceae bacterium]